MNNNKEWGWGWGDLLDLLEGLLGFGRVPVLVRVPGSFIPVRPGSTGGRGYGGYFSGSLPTLLSILFVDIRSQILLKVWEALQNS